MNNFHHRFQTVHLLNCRSFSRSHISHVFVSTHTSFRSVSGLTVRFVGHSERLLKHLGILLQCHGPFSPLVLMMSPPVCTATTRTGSVSAPHFILDVCVSSAPVNATPALMGPHASPGHRWKLRACAHTDDKGYFVMSVSLTKKSRKRAVCKQLVHKGLEQLVK